MSLTSSQLSQLLEAFPDPARLVDDQGETIAQNQAAALSPQAEFTAKQPLEDGVFLCRQTKSVLTGRVSFDLLARELMHEVRNPLSAIMTAAQLIQSSPSLDEETQLLLGIVSEETTRINRILKDFSAYLKIPHAQPVEMDVAKTARRLIARLQREGVLRPAISVQDDLPEELLVWADEELVERALLGVLQNAAEAMSSVGILRLAGSTSPPTLCVEDSGPGFSSEDLEQAFEPFYSTRTKQTGLGLAVAHAAVEACGGQIHLKNLAESTPDACGARVCLELPPVAV